MREVLKGKGGGGGGGVAWVSAFVGFIYERT